METVCAGAGASGLAAESFDRALLVTVLGEIPDRAAALAELYSLLRPGGILSVTEVIPDPHYQSRASVVRQAEAAGFRLAEEFGGWVAFTLNFSR